MYLFAIDTISPKAKYVQIEAATQNFPVLCT